MNQNQNQTITPTKRINSIDVLRGFALMGIFLLHCMEHFDLTFFPQLESPFWQRIDTAVYDTIRFLFQGKSYAIFSLLFGLGFFMQMDSNAKKGSDFRLRFAWRLTILLLLGYLNGMVYMGEFFVIYAILGLLLIPLWKVPTRWLVVITALLFLQIPQIIQFVWLLCGIAPNEPSVLNVQMNDLFGVAAETFSRGSLLEVLRFNSFEGQFAKILWFINEYRYPQIIGLIISGMLIGRSGVHKSQEMMVKYIKRFCKDSKTGLNKVSVW